MSDLFKNIYPNTVEKIEQDLINQVIDMINFHTNNGLDEGEKDDIKRKIAEFKILLVEVSNYYTIMYLEESFQKNKNIIEKIDNFILNLLFKR